MNPNQLGRSPFPAHASQWMLVGLRGGAVIPPFDPSTIAGLKVWLKADALALSDGAAVATWADSSGTGYDLTQATAGQRPIYKANIVNGKPAVKFTAASSQNLFNAAKPAITQPDSIFIAGFAAGTNSGRFLDCTGVGRQLLDVDISSGNFQIFAGTAILADALNHNAAWHVFTAIFDSFTGPGSFGYVDGAQVFTGNPGINDIGQVQIGSANGLAYLDGYIAEILIYNSALVTTDRQAVELYLKTKYATP